MVEVRRVALPGVGVMHSFTTADGVELAVVAHRTGSSDLVARRGRDDRHAMTLRLDEDEAHTLAELLGGTRVIESIIELDDLPGVPIDWFSVDDDDAIVDHPVGLRARRRRRRPRGARARRQCAPVAERRLRRPCG